jgi:hypothetical protein
VFIAEKETDFLRDVLRIFKVGANVRSSKRVLFLIGGGRAMENERLLRFASVPARPSFLLEVDWDGMCPKIKIKPIRHRDCQSSLTLCLLLTKSRQLFSAKFQALAKLVYSPCDEVPRNRERAEGHLDGFDRVGLLVHFRARSQTLFG